MKPTIIMGAGLTGLSCAYHMKNDYVLLEKDSEPGGLCRSLEINGFTFDYTGHFLHLHTDYGRKFVREMLKGNVDEITRNSLVYSHNTCTKYPYQANLYGLPDSVIRECILGYLEAYCGTHNDGPGKRSYHDWIIRTFGRGFAKNFFFPYMGKLFGVPVRELTADWIAPFVPQPGPEEIILGATESQDKLFGYNVRFNYPRKGGIGALVKAIGRKVKKPSTLSGVTGIDLKNKLVAVGKEKMPYRNIVSTIPLPELLGSINDLPAALRKAKDQLRWNSVYCLNIGIAREKISDAHWIYFPESEYSFYRVGFYGNVSRNSVPAGSSSMYVEVPYADSNGNCEKNGLAERVIKDLNKCRILKRNDHVVVADLLPIRYAYVIFDKNYARAVKLAKDFLMSNDIRPIGRFGAWKYTYMEESINEGKFTAEEICK